MTLLTPDQIDAIKRDNPCDRVAAQWVSLRSGSSKFGPGGFTGPCPIHTAKPNDPAATIFECSREAWVCVRCGGGDVIKLVALRNGLDADKDFRRVLTLPQGGLIRPWDGTPAKPLSEAERRAVEEARAEEQAQRAQEDNEFRDRERRMAWDLYYGRAGRGGWDTFRLSHPLAAPARDYLRRRGLAVPDSARLRFNPHARFYVPDRPKAREIHRGPALLGMIQRQDADGKARFAGVHMTFLDLDNAPKFKAHIVDPKTGQAMNAKKVRGAQRGGHIDLLGPREPRTLVLGEGLEKALAVYTALQEGGRDVSEIAFWSAMNLDNMGGRHAGLMPHPTLSTQSGRRARVPGPMPDLAAPGIALPASVRKVILLGDSTSDRFTTQCVIARAALRFHAQAAGVTALDEAGAAALKARSDLAVVAAWGPEGLDFDDVLREAE